jgi:MFS family permease
VLSGSGLAPRKVGLAIAGWLVTAAVANFVGPWVSDRIGRRRPLILGGALLAGVALAAVAASPPASAGWGLMVAAVGGGCFAPLLFALPLELRGVWPARAGAAIGLLSLVGQLGGFVLPVLVGAVAQGAGFAAAMGLLAVVHAAIVLPALGLKEGLKDGEEARSAGLGDEAVA